MRSRHLVPARRHEGMRRHEEVSHDRGCAKACMIQAGAQCNRARLIQENEEYRRNQHRDARRARFREFLSCDWWETGQPQEPQHSGPKGRRDRLPPHAAHRLHRAETRKTETPKTTVFHQAPENPTAMWERGFPLLGGARLFGSLRPRARRLTALRLKNGPQYRRRPP